MQTYEALDGRVDVIRPVEHLLGGPESDEIVSHARYLTNNGRVALLVDLADVNYVNSLGLSVFTRLVVAYSRVHGSVKICNLRGRVRALFDIVRFHVLFEYYDSEQAALEAFARELKSPADA